MTWITDNGGTRWVPTLPRKRRKPGRALRFENLEPGDILIHRQKWKSWHGVKHEIPVANDDAKIEQGMVIGFALCEHRWFDPVAGERDPVAGEMAGIRLISSYGRSSHLRPHTLRGLAQNGYRAASDAQSAAIRAWLAQYEELTQKCLSGAATHSEGRMRLKSWATMLRECGLHEEHKPPSWGYG